MLAAVAAGAVLSACSTLVLASGGGSDAQLDAALQEIRDTRPSDLILERRILAPVEVLPDPGAQLVLDRDGPHNRNWLNEAVAGGMADGTCDDNCSPSASTTILALSLPYRGGNAVFVDAVLRGSTDSGFGSMRFHRVIRIQLSRVRDTWRAVAMTPLWESGA